LIKIRSNGLIGRHGCVVAVDVETHNHFENGYRIRQINSFRGVGFRR
jgi:trehalose-6-phosphatase